MDTMKPLPLMLIALIAAGLSTGIAGCATTTGACDPTRADFFNNTSCLASGAYRERQRGLASTLASEQSRNRAFKNLLADLEAEQTSVRSDLNAQRAAYARADANWRQIKQSLAAATSSNPALKTRVRQIDEDMAAREAGKRAERDALANKVALLQQELDSGVYD